jgi:hypothetical protein
MDTECVFLSLAVGQIEHLSWVQNGPVGFKKHTVCKKQYICVYIFCASGASMNK